MKKSQKLQIIKKNVIYSNLMNEKQNQKKV